MKKFVNQPDRVESDLTAHHSKEGIEATVEASEKIALSRTRIGYLVLGTIALLFLGLIYSWSIFSTPIDNSFGYGRSALDVVFSIAMACFCVGTLSASFLTKRISPRNVMLLSGFVMGAGFALTALFGGMGLGVIYGCYGVLTGIACGLGYNAIISTVNLWFPERIGLASGILLLGYGAGALLLGAPIGQIINNIGWQTTFMWLALGSIIVLGIAAFVLKTPPEDIVTVFPRKVSGDGDDNHVAVPSKAHGAAFIFTNVTFLLFLCWRMSAMTSGLTLIGDTEQGALQVGIPMDFALLMVGIVSICNGVSRIFFGALFDRKGTIVTMVSISSLALFASLCVAAAFQTSNSLLYIAGAVAMGFSFGGFPVMSSSFSMELFGRQDYSVAFAFSNCALIPASLFSGLLVTLLRGPFGDVAVYLVLGLFVVASFAFLTAVGKRYNALRGKRQAEAEIETVGESVILPQVQLEGEEL